MVGTWMRLAHVELSSAGDLDSGTFTAKENLKVTINSLGNGAVNNRMRFNGSSSSDYTFRVSGNGGSDSTSTSQTGIPIGNGNTQSPDNAFDVVNITNIASKEKLVIGHTITDEGTGSGNAPQRNEVVGKWINTSAQITRIQLVNTGSGNFSAGSYITVWGASDDVLSDEKDSLTNVPVNTRYEETDTRKIYRRTEAGEYLKVGTKWTPDSTTITYTGNTNTDNHGVSYDVYSALGNSVASDTWVLRFEHTVTSTIGTSNGDVNVFCGLSDKDMNTTHQQNQDWIGARLMLSAKSGSDYGLIRPNSSNDGSAQGGSASNNYGYMGSGTENTKFYIEIIRTSSSAYTISISNGNDYNGDVLSATGGSTSSTALRYIKFGGQANTSTQSWNGKIENVQFWDNTVSAGGGTEVAIAKAEWKERGTA